MKVWDTGSESVEPNNCAMCRVIIYNDGWMCAWFDKEAHSQDGTGLASFVDAQTLGSFGIICEYPDKYNGCDIVVNSSSPTDTECPDGTTFTIRDTDEASGQIKVHKDCSPNAYHFNTGHTYTVSIHMSNGNLVWWGVATGFAGTPPNLANRLYRAIYEMWENLRYSSNTTAVTDTAITRAFLDDGAVFTDYTTDFNNATINDVPLIPATEAVDDAFYYGMADKFGGLNLNIGTAGVGNTIVWEYWTGSAWSTLSVTDNTTGFTVAGTNAVTFAPPDDWTKTTIETYDYYWVRSRVSVAAFTTQPLLTQGWIKEQDSLSYLDTNLGMYSFADTSALYCLICGKTVYDTEGYFYNTCLLGKIIYCHVLNYGVTTTTSSLYSNDTEIAVPPDVVRLYGFANINTESIDGDPGIQNVYKIIANNYDRMKVAAVLITS